MTAGRAAGHGDEIGVTAVVGDVAPYPGHSAFHIDDMVRPRMAGTSTVVNRHAHPALLGHPAHQRIRLPAFAIHGPRSAWNLDEHWSGLSRRRIRVPPDIKQVVAPAGAIADVAVRRGEP